jgi:hypothetical protein
MRSARARWVACWRPLRLALALTWPFRTLELPGSFERTSEEERPMSAESQAQGIEALVEAAQEEGILEQDRLTIDRSSSSG